MKRFTLLAATAFLVALTVGCHHNCNNCGPRGGGVLGGGGAAHPGHHGDCNVATGCRACKLGWQHGGHDYSEGLATGNPLHAFPGRQSPGAGGAPAGAYGAGAYGAGGPPTAGVAYPYYTTRGPRDFLLDNPPSIGR